MWIRYYDCVRAACLFYKVVDSEAYKENPESELQ